MITIKQYKESKKKVEQISKEIHNNSEKASEQRRKIEKEADDKIQRIRDLNFKESRIITKKAEEFKEKKDIELKPFEDDLISFNRILKLFEVHIKNNNTALSKVEVYDYDYPKDDKGEVIRVNGNYPEKEKIYYKPVGIIAQDDFKDVKIYLVKNDYRKKVNRFSLWVVGVCAFGDDLIKLPYSYSGDFRTEHENIKQLLKEGKTREELLKWLEKNKDKIFKEKLEEIKKVQEEYEEVIKLWEDKEWKIAFYEKQKEYYEKGYHHGTETEEYKEVIKKLKALK